MTTPTPPPLTDAERAELKALRNRECIAAECARIATATAHSFAEVYDKMLSFTQLWERLREVCDALTDARRYAAVQLDVAAAEVAARIEAERERDAALRHAAEWEERAGAERKAGRLEAAAYARRVRTDAIQRHEERKHELDASPERRALFDDFVRLLCETLRELADDIAAGEHIGAAQQQGGAGEGEGHDAEQG